MRRKVDSRLWRRNSKTKNARLLRNLWAYESPSFKNNHSKLTTTKLIFNQTIKYCKARQLTSWYSGPSFIRELSQTSGCTEKRLVPFKVVLQGQTSLGRKIRDVQSNVELEILRDLLVFAYEEQQGEFQCLNTFLDCQAFDLIFLLFVCKYQPIPVRLLLHVALKQLFLFLLKLLSYGNKTLM